MTLEVDNIMEWKVHEDRVNLSDHRLILFKISTNGPNKNVAEVIIDYKHTNWHSFRSFLNQKEWKCLAMINKLWIEKETKIFKDDVDKALLHSTKTYNKSTKVEKPKY